MQILGANGNLVSPQNKHSQKTSNTSKDTKHAPEPGSDRLVVSPYNIVLYNGIYFLIGNRLLGYMPLKKYIFILPILKSFEWIAFTIWRLNVEKTTIPISIPLSNQRFFLTANYTYY